MLILTPLAKPFNEIQQQVAGIIKDRILVGHAIHNDLKVRNAYSIPYADHQLNAML